jgi:hypothetical protein
MDVRVPLAEGTAEPALPELVQRLAQSRHHLRCRIARLHPQGVEQFGAVRVGQRREVGAPGRGRGDRHARADVHARQDQRAARPQRVDQHDVQAVAHAEVHVGAGHLGQLRQVQPGLLPEVEVPQVRGAQVQQFGSQAEPVAAGRLAQEAARLQRCGQPRHRRLGNAGALGQVAVGQRLVGIRYRTKDRQPTRERADSSLPC